MDTGGPSAVFLQARISALTRTLVERIENIFAAALPSSTDNEPKPPLLTTTAYDQYQIDVDSTALVRAAEEITVLTRQLKDLWLFGGLDTLHKTRGSADQSDKRMEEDARVVGDFVKTFVAVGPVSTDEITGAGRNDLKVDGT